jgi:hypothetical protein
LTDWNQCPCGNRCRRRTGSKCGSCLNRDWRARNPHMAKLSSRCYYLNNFVAIREKQDVYREENRDTLRANHARYHAAHRDERLAYFKEYRKQKKEQS